MSSDETQRLTRLTVRARLGVTFRVLDSSLRELTRGADDMELALPPGLYVIEWKTAGTSSESLVRIDPDGPPSLEVRYQPEPGEKSDDQAAAPTKPTPALPREDLVALVGTALRPSEKAYESSVSVVVAGDDDLSPSEALIDARLFNREDVAMRASQRDEPALQLGNGEFARCYRVRPGRFHLRFRSTTGETLAQSVPALAGRQTIVFLRAARANLLVATGETFVKEEGVGIDASRTVAITVAGDETDLRIRERIRLAGVLLHDLAAGTGSLSQEFNRVLGEPETDPLLRLYAAAVAQSCIDLGLSPAVDEARPEKGPEGDAFVRRWLERMALWVNEPGQPGMPVDATTLRWRVRKTAEWLGETRAEDSVPARIEVPPMLECSWRWAISESVERPNAVPSTPSILAATRSAGGTTPWLCWKASAAKAAKGPEPRDKEPGLSHLMTSVAAKTDLLLSRDRTMSALEGVAMDPLRELSPEIAATALRTFQLAGSGAEESAVNGLFGGELETALALSLSLPAGQLRRRLARTREELDALLRDDRAPAEKERVVSNAPGLALRPDFPDDPQRGRFGGERRRGGFVISAAFEPTSSKNWARIVMRVEGNAPEGTEVEFHLHDSFKPSLKLRRFKRGIAELVATAWGGFTVGAWIPSLAIELELNLASLRDAPRIIKTR